MRRNYEVNNVLRDFMSLVTVYLYRLDRGLSIYQLQTNLEEEILIYMYNKEENSEDLKALSGFIEKDEDIEKNRYALAYAISKKFNTRETGNKDIDEYILKMSQNHDKMILVS